jgi:hypothetical protein
VIIILDKDNNFKLIPYKDLSFLTLNFPGDSHEKGLYEVAGTRPPIGLLYSFGGFSVFGPFQAHYPVFKT